MVCTDDSKLYNNTLQLVTDVMLNLKNFDNELDKQPRGRIVVRLLSLLTVTEKCIEGSELEAESVFEVRRTDSSHGTSPLLITPAGISFFQNAHNVDANSGTWNAITNQYNHVNYPITVVPSSTGTKADDYPKSPNFLCKFNSHIKSTNY